MLARTFAAKIVGPVSTLERAFRDHNAKIVSTGRLLDANLNGKEPRLRWPMSSWATKCRLFLVTGYGGHKGRPAPC